MGFANVISVMMLFTVVMGALLTIVTLAKDYTTTASASLKEQNDIMLKKLQTEITITNASYDGANENITIKVVNTGKITLSTEFIDIFVDGARIPRSDDNRTIWINISTEVLNPGLWDPDEEVLIGVSYVLQAGTHRIDLTSENDARDVYNFQSG